MPDFLPTLSNQELVFLALAVLSILVTIILYVRSKNVRVPVYTKDTHVLVQASIAVIPDLTVNYRGATLNDVKVTQFKIWNRGQKPIRRADSASKDPLRIQADNGGEILVAKIDSCTSDTNDFRLLPSDFPSFQVGIDFEFFGCNEGMKLSVYHSGSAHLRGTIIGAGSFRYFHDEPFMQRASVVFELFSPILKWAERLPKIVSIPVQIPIVAMMFVVGFPFLVPAILLDLATAPFRRAPKFQLDEDA